MQSEWFETNHHTLPNARPAAMQQSIAYARACAVLGNATVHLGWGPPNAPRGRVQVLMRHWPGMGRVAMVARGPQWCPDAPGPARRTALQQLCATLNTQYRAVLITPDLIDAHDPMRDTSRFLPLMSGATLAEWPLRGDLRAGLSGKWRNRLVRAETAGLTIRAAPLPSKNRHWLLTQDQTQARAKRYRTLPRSFVPAWARANGPNAGIIYTAHACDIRIAAVLLLYHGACASYHIGWSGPLGRKLNAHNLLLYHAAQQLQAQQFRRFDLGILDTHTAPGLARFKLGTGANAQTLGQARIAAPATALFARMARHLNRRAHATYPQN